MADTLAHVRKTANVLNKLPKSYGIVRVRSDFSRNLAMGDVQVQVLVHGAFNAGRDHAVYLDPPSGAVVVPNSLRWIVRDALCGDRTVRAGGGWHRAPCVVRRGQTCSRACCFRSSS
jgi:hypothetical protein